MGTDSRLTYEEIAKLPTLLDIVNHYLEREKAIEERVNNSRFAGLFPTRSQKGFFEPIMMEDGTYILLPLSPAQHSYYRGESSYHDDCCPSLFRKNMDVDKIFVERVKRCEMERMMLDYPITNLFANSVCVKAPDGNWIQIPFRIGFDGMAQHYGIKTEFMDMTLDPYTAAFFAATTYDSDTDIYSPITDINHYPYGVFYLYNEISLPGEAAKHQRIDVVGMQPLSRPGRQSAYVCKMKQGENFNNIAQKTFFRHDATINQSIVERFNKDNALFPDELLNQKIRSQIVNGKVFSRWAYNEAKKRYVSTQSDETLMTYLTDNNITICADVFPWFSDAEKKDAEEYWETYLQELFSKIQLRWTYSGPIIIENE